MARKDPDPLLELDPLKGGLKHNPFAALRGKVEVAGTPPGAAIAPDGKSAPAESPSAKPKSAVTPNEKPKSAATPGAKPVPAPAPASGLEPASKGSGVKLTPAPPQSRISVRIERAGRGGKTVTIVEGPGLAVRKLEPLAREIARGMGTGARVEGAAIVVQGDQRERLVDWLADHGIGGAALGN